MAVYLSPIGNEQIFDSNGAPLVGGYWEVYLSGTTTPKTTYTSSAGTTPQPAQIVLDASGRPANPIWLTGGVPVKFRLFDADDAVLLTLDNISGVNDPSAIATADQWIPYTGTPTYISGTSFSVPGDQTALFHVGRRVRTTNTGGVRYSSITASAYTSVTTVTVANDSGTLDAGLSDVAYGILSAVNPSTPNLYAAKGANSDITELNGLTKQITGLQGGVPRGHVGLFSLASAPSGYLKANGALISRTTYAELWAVVLADGYVSEAAWSGGSQGRFSEGDGSTTFRLPDLRGEFIRVFDDGRGIDSGRTLGSQQADELKSHTHVQHYGSNGSTSGGFANGATGTDSGVTTVTTSATGGTETRPRNISLLACIKY